MTTNEIKKALYKEKPLAWSNAELIKTATGERVSKAYKCTTSLGDHYFEVPFSEMGETTFEDEMPAQLLIRWLNKSE